MPKRVEKTNRPKDINQLAHDLVDLSTRESLQPEEYPDVRSMVVSQYMAEIGRKGGQIGGKRRLQTMTSKQRRRAASRAAKVRWKKGNRPR